MKLNAEELVIGAIVGLTFAIKVGWLALPLACLTSFLWAYTGAGASKLYRRLLIPVLCAGLVALVYKDWLPLVSIPLAFVVLSLGYGIPTLLPPDNGSVLGRIAFKLAKGKESLAHLYCRTFIYVLLALAFIPCLIKG